MPSRPILVFARGIGAWSVLATAQRPDRLSALETRVERLHAHIENIESVRAIKRVQYAYGHYVELGLWNDFADLFTGDAVTNYQSGVRGEVRARTLDLGGSSGGAGYWSAGAWRFQTAGSSSRWSAPYPGGWARIP